MCLTQVSKCSSSNTITVCNDKGIQLAGTSTVDPLAQLRCGDEVEVFVGPSTVENSSSGGGRPRSARWVVGVVTDRVSDTSNAGAAAVALLRIRVAPSAAPVRSTNHNCGSLRGAAPQPDPDQPDQSEPELEPEPERVDLTGGGVIVASLDSRPFYTRARAVSMVLRQDPQALEGAFVQYIPPQTANQNSLPSIQFATVATYLHTEGMHVLIREEADTTTAATRLDGSKKLEMADLRTRNIAHPGGAGAVEPRSGAARPFQ